jgi:8-oxo-dGTP pyrophosphatase MutT (NUDIX family)
MAISPYVRGLRDRIGTSLLLVPTVAVLPIDADGRILLVQQISTGSWTTIGGTVEPDESPEDAAVREAAEEAGVVVRLGRLLAALGGVEYRLTYPNGDEISSVPIVFEATVESGTPRPDRDETSAVAWYHPHEMQSLDINGLNRHLLAAVLPLLR